ncbi:MAG: Na+/H+ antiporter subunit E [Deltaproteobacteria bacterium]|nr:Na+/H+ antiporter subunit E [Deltaproteobacteria bacterium]MCW5808883.1 Na+/H+ antiporter subunit E [Deltaproteobacteria bacterium]
MVLAIGWWVLAEGRPGVVFGVFLVLLALLASLAVPPAPAPPSWHLRGLLRFAYVFVTGSVRGGFDVARRALAPRLAIDPDVMAYRTRLPEGAARQLLLGASSLMPGTLPIGGEGRVLELHVIAAREGLAGEIADLETAVAAATGARLEEEPRA